jgi:diguanylate cyclase (GGDEF)-like protein
MMNAFEEYQITAEKLKDDMMDKNRKLTRQLAEKNQSFDLVKMVHFNKEVNLQTLNDILIGCTGCLHSFIFSNKMTISNLKSDNTIYISLVANREQFMNVTELQVNRTLIEGFTTIIYPVGISDLIEGHHHVVRCIVMLYPNKVMDNEVLEFIKSFMIVNEVMINIVLTRERMTELIETDPLTKALNRLAWRENLKRLLIDVVPFYVLMIDVDRFKIINDTYGHPKGDEVLKFTAAWLKNSVRADDKVFRLGGDEFAVMGIINPYEENTLIDKLMAFNANYQENAQKFLKLDTSISIGVLFTDSNQTEDEIFSKVDELLYQSKTSGKNTMTIQNELG